MPTRDSDIRAALHSGELAAHACDPHTLVLDEMAICQGDFRIDVAVVNGSLSGYEIKSDRDTLLRLPAQAEAYGRVFDRVTLVVGDRHLGAAASLVPEWWRILGAVPSPGGLTALRSIREGSRNPELDVLALARFLWTGEALALLESRGGLRGLRGKSRRHLWAALAERYGAEELSVEVRAALRARPAWRTPGRAAAPRA